MFGARTSRIYEIKFNSLLAFITIGISITLVGFSIYNLNQDYYLISVIALLSAAGFSAINLIPVPQSRRRLIARLCIGFLTGVLFYTIIRGENDGFAILSFYVFPLVLFFFLGKKDGLIWLIIVLIGFGVIFGRSELFPEMNFKSNFIVRFNTTFLLVSFFSFLIESFRQRTQEKLIGEQQKLQKQKIQLQKAMSEIKMLRGILTICSFCKKIKNDEGDYESIEKYIHGHSDVKFSHGVCQECAEKYYPELYLNKQTTLK